MKKTRASRGVAGRAGDRRYHRDLPANALTIDDCMYRLGLDDWLESDEFLQWPPDVFAACAMILRESGAYVSWVREASAGEVAALWSEARMRSAAAAWRARFLQAPPREIVHLVDRIRARAGERVGGVCKSPVRFELIRLMVLADQASAGFGLPPPKSRPSMKRGAIDAEALWRGLARTAAFQAVNGAARELDHADESAPRYGCTLSHRIHPSRALVLPKMRTPQRGVSLRSFTHHLAYVAGGDVRPYWNVARVGSEDRDYKPHVVAVVPFPFEIRPAQFHPCRVPADLPGRLPRGHRFFSFRHGPLPRHFRQRVDMLIDSIHADVGPLSGLIFPEMAMSRDQFDETFGDGLPEGVNFLICGVYEPARDGRLGRNYAVVRLRSDSRPIERVQYKHHRWALDTGQIRSYGLGSVLDPRHLWWEAIDLPERDLHFFHLDNHAVFSVLICEDLARPDPVGDCLRAVGPNLVLGLLSDGPQISSRWSARCATVLADDPGSSVLTVSSLGMVGLSRPDGRPTEHSRTVALWREPVGVHTPSREIAVRLEPDAEVIVLSLMQQPELEHTIDGRPDGQHLGNAGTLRLGGIFQTRIPK